MTPSRCSLPTLLQTWRFAPQDSPHRHLQTPFHSLHQGESESNLCKTWKKAQGSRLP